MYYLAIIREWRDLAQEKREKETVKVCNKLLKRYKFLEGKFKTMSKYRKIKKIEGTPAFQGNAQGKVRVILDEAEARQLQKGEILVAKMISAKFAFVLNRAKAIVADQGGMLCHTAMLSREFGIPCVIATRVATKVLKDGDLVKVNANKGIVKILKKAK